MHIIISKIIIFILAYYTHSSLINLDVTYLESISFKAILHLRDDISNSGFKIPIPFNIAWCTTVSYIHRNHCRKLKINYFFFITDFDISTCPRSHFNKTYKSKIQIDINAIFLGIKKKVSGRKYFSRHGLKIAIWWKSQKFFCQFYFSICSSFFLCLK